VYKKPEKEQKEKNHFIVYKALAFILAFENRQFLYADRNNELSLTFCVGFIRLSAGVWRYLKRKRVRFTQLI